MKLQLREEDIANISKILGAEPQILDNSYSWKLHNQENNQALIFTIFEQAKIDEDTTICVVSAQTKHGYFELHSCTNYMVFEPDEIIFLEVKPEFISCLIMGKEATCSMFSNINRKLLAMDLTQIDSPLLLSAMQLSITESVLG